MIRMLAIVLFALALSATSLAAQAPAVKASTAKVSTASAPINLNTATAAQLDSLPGIGKATADRIIEYRQKNGGFKKPEELMNVRGVGEKNFLKLRAQISVGAPKADHAGNEHHLDERVSLRASG